MTSKVLEGWPKYSCPKKAWSNSKCTMKMKDKDAHIFKVISAYRLPKPKTYKKVWSSHYCQINCSIRENSSAPMSKWPSEGALRMFRIAEQKQSVTFHHLLGFPSLSLTPPCREEWLEPSVAGHTGHIPCQQLWDWRDHVFDQVCLHNPFNIRIAFAHNHL
jgi:hypothetical protein